MNLYLALPALLLVLVTAVPLLRFDQWWIRVLDFPRIQFAISGSLLVVLYACFWQRLGVYDIVVSGLLLLALGYQMVKIFPYTVLMPKQILAAESHSGGDSVSLLVINVMMENRESLALLDIVRDYDPDMILTMETDAWWEEALRSLEQRYPNTLKAPLDNTFGMLLHSRLDLVDPKIRYILKDGVPSMHMQVVLPSGERVFLHFVHPEPPNPKYATETTKRDAELLMVGRHVDHRDKPTIVAGDFNDVPWSTTTNLFRKTSGLLDLRVGRRMCCTFDASNPLLRWPLDHVFLSTHFKLVRMEKGPAWGSDHFPFFIKMSLSLYADATQEEADTSRAEEGQVGEMIEDGKQEKGE